MKLNFGAQFPEKWEKNGKLKDRKKERKMKERNWERMGKEEG